MPNNNYPDRDRRARQADRLARILSVLRLIQSRGQWNAKTIDHGLWWPLLEGKRLAIVSGHADEFAARLVKPEFVKSAGGGEITWSIAAKITCRDKTVAKRELWNRVLDELFAEEWDLLLCSAGSLSAVICEAARQRGRKAIDVGSSDVVVDSCMSIGSGPRSECSGTQ